MKQDFKIVSSVRNTAAPALTAKFRGLAVCLKRTVNLLDLKSDSTSTYELLVCSILKAKRNVSSSRSKSEIISVLYMRITAWVFIIT